MTMSPMPICEACKHRRTTASGTRSCKAYPQWIPNKIFEGGFDHRNPFKGDHGVLFELDDTPESLADLRAYEEFRAMTGVV